MAAAIFGANMFSGDTLARASLLMTANMAEIGIVSMIISQRNSMRLISLAGMTTLTVGAVIGCILSATIATAGLVMTGDTLPLQDMIIWFSADFLGIILFAPILWSLTDRSHKFVSQPPTLRSLIEYLLVCATTVYVFAQSDYPFLFLIPPVLVLLSFSGGVKGAAVGLLAVAAISIPFSFADSGPTSLMDASFTEKVLTLQLFLASNSILALAVGAAASDRRRMLRQIERARQHLRTKTRQQAETLSKALLAEKMIGLGNWSLDPQTKIVTWSPQVYAIHGVTPDNFNPNYGDAVDFYIPEDRDMVREFISIGIQQATGWEFKATIKRRSDGQLRRVRSIADCLTDRNGQVIRVFGIFIDITEQEQLLESVRESEARYKILADHSTDIIVRFGLDGIITYASPACRILGITPEEAVGMSTLDFVIPEDREYAAKITEDLFRHDEPDQTVRREFRARNAKGEIIWLEGSPQIVKGEAGEPKAVVSTFRDVTERKEREETLAAARAAAEDASRAKADFLSNMSHEIRTPLNGILGFAKLLEQTDLNQEQQHYLERTVSAGRMLREIVDDILDFSKIEAGKITLEEQSLLLPDVISHVVEIIDAGRKNKSVSLECDVSPIAMKADGTRLKQILANLIGNAAKFTEAGSILVRAAEQDGSVVIEVRDTGPGIPPEQLETVFEGFRQADNSITRRFGGTGLGLSISRSLARQMGGDLVLESEVGTGTTARITLPYVKADMAQAAKPAGVIHHASRPLNIMAVDDVGMNLELLELGLGKAGHTVSTYASAQGALDALQAGERFDLILMDIQMPEIDGVTATRKIREMPGPTGETPIIALSANVLPEQVNEYLKAGMNAHFPKPVDPAALAEFLQSFAALGAPAGSGANGKAAARPQAPLEDAMEKLKRDYKVYLSGVVMEFAEITGNNDREQALGGIRQIAHAVAGSAGSFGFGEVSDAAFALEKAAAGLAGENRFSDDFMTKLRTFLIVTERAAA
jgi:PAS domain S-box-containing protein